MRKGIDGVEEEGAWERVDTREEIDEGKGGNGGDTSIGGEGASEIEVDLEEGTLLLQVGEEVDEPLKRRRITIRPVEFHSIKSGKVGHGKGKGGREGREGKGREGKKRGRKGMERKGRKTKEHLQEPCSISCLIALRMAAKGVTPMPAENSITVS